jgi:two-component system chemotaxis response regulator CheY
MGEPKKYTILVVDDEVLLRNTIVFDLKRKGFNVLVADNGTEGLKLVKANKIHLVISDIRMPDGDGITFLEKIREHDPSIPVVIFITGFADITEDEVKKKGAKGVVTKPFDRKTLMASVLDSLGLPKTASKKVA